MKFILILILGTAGRLDATPSVSMAEFDNQKACVAAAEAVKQIHSYPKRYLVAHCAAKG